MKFDDLRWHDGNISRIEIIPDNISSINIHAQLYDNSTKADGRESFLIECIGVTKFNTICDFEEIYKNTEYGSIHDAVYKNRSLRLSMYDGYIEISLNEIKIKKC